MKYLEFSYATKLAIFLLLFGTGLVLASSLVTFASPGKISQAGASVISFLLPSLAFVKICQQSPPVDYLGLSKLPNWKMFLLSVIAIVAAFPLAIWLSEINKALPVPEWMFAMEQDAAKRTQSLLQGEGVMIMLANVFVMALVPAVCEEVCFRGVIQRLAIQSLRLWPGILVTSLFFAAFHFQFQGFLPRFFFSTLLGAMYCYTGSIWTSIVAHFIVNAIQVVAVYA
jgi:membrane protease YdiL (CAAX protease family)